MCSVTLGAFVATSIVKENTITALCEQLSSLVLALVWLPLPFSVVELAIGVVAWAESAAALPRV